MAYRLSPLLTGGLLSALLAIRGTPSPTEVTLNDNREPAGRLHGGVLTLRLEVRTGTWRPEGPDGLAAEVAAFAEEGGALQVPGPLVRVPVGTTVHATVRNTLRVPVTIYGFGERRGLAGDTVVIAPDEAHAFRFSATTPGSFYYAGRTTHGPGPLFTRNQEDSQLNGAIVVDPPEGAGAVPDRVFLISLWVRVDSTKPSGIAKGLMTLNGRSWPHTERIEVAQGDSLHWRVLNLTNLPHPMHLHGFYFQLRGRGDGVRYDRLAPAERRLAVTEAVPPGGAMELAWAPTRPGNWIFHCHMAAHITPTALLDASKRYPEVARRGAGGPHAMHAPPGTAAGSGPMAHAMGGLVLGIHVRPRGATVRAGGEPRRLRLLIRSLPDVYGPYAGYGYVLGGSPEEAVADRLTVPGPLLVLERGVPVAITLVNQSHEPAAVHWHGIELESFPDGVPGWSGRPGDLLPAVAPHDSLTVRFTPPRAGTFMYHSHFNEFQQIGSGLYGPIVVMEPGARYDSTTDRVLLFSDGGPTLSPIKGPFPPTLLNGQRQPAPIELRAGVRYRLRLINIHTDDPVALTLTDEHGPVAWRPIAKDGADLPASQATARPAELRFLPGEIHDVEFVPRAAGTLRLTYRTPPLGRRPALPATTVLVRVR
ncbi:MAG TPA: multicopper oxidase domain-containing protein [Gemmatimonadaceae bacterium]|nr:multicopper oxidase domain-containing protein [Gemmatimonadaceae bacterium]